MPSLCSRLHTRVIEWKGSGDSRCPKGNLYPRVFDSTQEIHAQVFNGCFTIMHRGLRFNICEIEDSSRLNEDIPDLSTRIRRNISEALRYASLFWASHLVRPESKENGKRIFAFLNSRNTLFGIEALSLLGNADRGIVALQDCVDFFTVCL